MKKLALLFSCIGSFSALAQFPGCPNIVAGPDQALPCSQNCTTLSATPFAVGSTTTYSVSSIPHTPPIAYNAAGGNAISVGTDDVWSAIISLPFPFCYYGNTYTTCKVGSNGSIMLGPAGGGGFSPWSYSAGCPSTALVNAGHIFGAYHDIDPAINTGSQSVKWYLQGTAPCRILVVSFNNIGHFSCTSLRTTQMIVLYETTNVIDVYIQRKDLCTGWNTGNAIVGIQNTAGTTGLAAPGRNAPTPDWSVPTSSPEGWRFSPNGTPIYTVEWVTGAVAGVGGTVIGTGNSINVCPNGVTTTYTARVTYTRCDGLVITDYDDVVVSYSTLPAPTVTPVAETCSGYNNGSVTINNAPGSGPYTVNISGPTTGSVVEANTAGAVASFTNLPDGNYTYTVVSANGCQFNGAFTINPGPTCCTVTANSTAALCFGQASGTATANPSGGVSPYSFIWFNAGMTPIGQTTQTATNLAAGTYNVQITDNTGCTATTSVVVGQPAAALNATLTPTNVSCFGQCNGQIVVNPPSGGTPGYTYSNNGGAYQASNTFGSLCPGPYTISVKDNNGCLFSVPTTITQPNDLTLVQTAISPETCGLNNGSVTVTAGGGTPGYTYAIGATTNINGIFNGLSSGPKVVTVTDSQGCTETLNITILSAAGPVPFVDVQTNVACAGALTGSVTIGVTGGTPAYQFKLDAGAFQASNTFNSVSAGPHTVTVQDLNGCTGTVNFTITQPSALTFNTVVTNASCNGVCDGQITVNASNATPPYQYSSNNGITFQTSNVLTGLCAGTINVVVKDANGCLANAAVVVGQPTVLNSVQAHVDPACHQTPTGEISFAAAGGTPAYQYSIDDGANFSGSTVFPNLMAGTYDVVVKDDHGCEFTSTVTLTDPPPFDFVFVANNPSNCGAQDGSFEIVATNGTGPYLYSIDGGVTTQFEDGYFDNLFAGLYNLVVEDNNGCFDSVYSALSDDEMFPVLDLVQDVTCYNGTDGIGAVSQINGSFPFEYEITPGGTVNATGFFDNLTAGTYYVEIHDNGLCLAIQQFTVNEPDTITMTLTPVHVTCNGGTDGQVTVSAPAGGDGGPYTYSIDGGPFQSGLTFSGLSAGTHTVTAMDGVGCLGAEDIVINQPTPFNVSMNSFDLECNGDNSGFAQVFATGSNPGTYTYTFGATTNTTGVFPALAANTYNIIVEDALGCTFDTTQVINEPPALVAAYVVSNTLCDGSCDGQIVVNAAGGTPSYLYSSNGGVLFQSGSTLAGLCAGNHTVIVKDANNCSVTAVQVVGEPTPLTYTTTITPSTCGLPNGEIQFNANGGTPVYTYSTDGGSTFVPGSLVTNLASNNYNTVVKDQNGCTASSPEFVPSETSPIITGVTVTNVSCNGACDGEIVVTASGGTGALTYDIGGPGNAGGIFGALCPNTYTITVTDINGCTDTQTESITEPAVLNLATVNTNLTCFNDNTGSIDANAVGGTTPYLYCFDGSGTFIVQDLAENLAAGPYNVQVQDDNGCIASVPVTLTEPAQMTIVSQNNVDASCFGLCDGSATLTVSGGTGAYTYNWAGAVAGPASNTAIDLCAGGYSVDVEDVNGCSIPATFTVGQPAMIGFTSVTGTDVTCNGACDGTMTINALNATGYSIDNGANFVPGNVFNGLCPGVYDVVIENLAGCTQTQQFTIIEPTALVQNPITDITICYDGYGVLEGTASGGTGGYYFVWDTGDTTQNLNVNLTAPATFTCIVYDQNGCASNPQSANVSILPQFFGVDPADVVLCPGDLAVFAGGNNGGGLAPYTYNWLNENMDTLGTDVNFSYVPTVAETIYLVAQDACQATDTLEVIVNFNGVPVPTFDAENIGCAPLMVTFENTTPNTLSGSEIWSFGDGNSGTGMIDSNLYLNPGCYDVTLTVTSLEGCVGTTTVSDAVCVNPNPVAGFYWTPDAPTTLEPTITIVDLSEGAVSYVYNFGGLGTSMDQNPQFTFPDVTEETTYEVCQIVTSADGCVDTLCQDVTIYEEIFFYVPNVFTPDGDPNNQTFKPVITSGVDMYDYHLTIFNRWGEVLFESFNYDFGWDGTYGDQGLVPDGVYVWQIEFGEKLTDKKQKHRGHVTVLK